MADFLSARVFLLFLQQSCNFMGVRTVGSRRFGVVFVVAGCFRVFLLWEFAGFA